MRSPSFPVIWGASCACVLALGIGYAPAVMSEESPLEPPEMSEPLESAIESPETVEERNRAALEDAVARAEVAADQATRALRALDEDERRNQQKRERTGPYFGAAFFYAAEHFDDRIIAKSSTGAAFVGYRFDPALSVEVRHEGFNGFDPQGRTGRGRLDGSALTVSAKAYPFRGDVQPFWGAGVGAIFVKQKLVDVEGSHFREAESDVVLRFAGGLDLWLTDSLVINLEAGYLAPVDNLSNLESTILSTG
jgi:hypothetical protein